MAVEPRRAAQPQPFGSLDPLRTAWQLLTNVKFALFLVGLALIACLLGVVIPQMPGPMRDNAAARDAWLGLRHQDFGALTGPMERLQLFEVFQSWWFNGLWLLIITAVTVCTVSRLRPTWRGIQRPPKVVGDRYFETAHHRADFSHEGGAAAVEEALRRRRYRVERAREADGATYLFAQRFAWSGYGTFLSHLALLMLLVGGLLTRFAGFDETLVLAEGTPGAPVFANPGPRQLFVTMLDAYQGKDAQGNIVDFHSDIAVTRGDTTVTCRTTVNDPCHAFGYSIHQAAYFNDIGRLRITDANGRLVYDDVVDFDGHTTAVPAMRVTDSAGNVLFDQQLPQMATVPGPSGGVSDALALAELRFPAANGQAAPGPYAVAWRIIAGKMALSVSGGGLVQPVGLAPGESAVDGPYRITFTAPASIPAVTISDMPGAQQGAVVQMPSDSSGTPYLFVTGLDRPDGAPNTVLAQGDALAPGNGYTYRFEGRVEASGVSVKRDPGDWFIWVAVGMAIVGLCVTFYVPRRRLWVKVTPGRTYLAGVAEKTTRLGAELRRMGAELGSKDALRPEDEQERY